MTKLYSVSRGISLKPGNIYITAENNTSRHWGSVGASRGNLRHKHARSLLQLLATARVHPRQALLRPFLCPFGPLRLAFNPRVALHSRPRLTACAGAGLSQGKFTWHYNHTFILSKESQIIALAWHERGFPARRARTSSGILHQHYLHSHYHNTSAVAGAMLTIPPHGITSLLRASARPLTANLRG